MLVKTYGSAVSGIDAKTITIEVDITRGIKFYLVGLPDNAVKESQHRIESALKNVGLKIRSSYCSTLVPNEKPVLVESYPLSAILLI